MTIAELKMILWKLDYTFKEAKTMPNIPHSYSLKTKWNNEELFKAVVNSIR